MSPLRARLAGSRHASGLLAALARTAEHVRMVDESDDTPALVCREAAGLVDAGGAVLYLTGPGRILVAARHGVHPAPSRSELDVDVRVERAIREGRIEGAGAELVVPLVGVGGVLGAVALYGVPDPDPSCRDALRVFGVLAGTAFERHGSVPEVGDVDPVFGVGDHRRAAASLASVRPGDGLIRCEIDGIRAMRAAHAPAADLAQGRFGLHLRNTIRPGDAVGRSGEEGFVLVLRQLRAPLDVVARRVLDDWLSSASTISVSAGAALHLEGAAPADTEERAAQMLVSAQAAGTGRLYLASAR